MRRALGDPSLGRVPAHLTLVPPVNVRVDQLPAALARVRAAAASQSGPLRLTLGPPATFLPDNPVLYLEVGGDLEALQALRDHTFVAPLQRTLSWPWIPHVTVSDMAETERIAAALVALDRFAVVATIEHLVLLEEQRGRLWSPIADAALGPPAVIGRGGLAVEITRSRLFDPEVIQMIQGPESAGLPEAGGQRVAAGSVFLPDCAVRPPRSRSRRRRRGLAIRRRRSGGGSGQPRNPGPGDRWDRARPTRGRGQRRGLGLPGAARPWAGRLLPGPQQLGRARGAYSNWTEAYRASFLSRCRASMRRTVPDLDRITRDSVVAPRLS